MEHGLHLQQLSPSTPSATTAPPPLPIMFMTSYRKKWRQLQEKDMGSIKTLIKALTKHNNFNLKLPSIKDNKSLYEACLEESTKRITNGNAEACVLVMRRGPLEEDVRASIKQTMINHRHLHWVQIDLDDHALQPLPLHENINQTVGGKKRKHYGHKWPRLALARSSPPLEPRKRKSDDREKKKKRKKDDKKKKKKKKKKKHKQAIHVQKNKKEVIHWRWYPSSLSLTDEHALNDFIDTVDASGWSVLDPLPSQSSKKLRIVRAK